MCLLPDLVSGKSYYLKMVRLCLVEGVEAGLVDTSCTVHYGTLWTGLTMSVHAYIPGHHAVVRSGVTEPYTTFQRK